MVQRVTRGSIGSVLVAVVLFTVIFIGNVLLIKLSPDTSAPDCVRFLLPWLIAPSVAVVLAILTLVAVIILATRHAWLWLVLLIPASLLLCSGAAILELFPLLGTGSFPGACHYTLH